MKSFDFDVATELRAFYAMLEDPKFQRELRDMLPDTVTVAAFVRTAKTATQNNPGLLKPDWRPSLMRSITKAAAQGLLPDGKHGALIPRKDNAAGGNYQVCWSPMVWGITQLGRRAGAIQKMNAHIVFDGEEFEVLGGEEDRIRHKINPVIVEKVYAESKTSDEFLQHVAFAYCIITAPSGAVTWRYMTRSRIARVKAASAASNGPWNGAFADEMILKTVILFTAKHIDLDGDSADMRRFREAMETDMEADLEGEAVALEAPADPSLPALPAPSPKLDNLEQQLRASLDKQPVAVQTETAEPLVADPPPAKQPAVPSPKDERKKAVREFINEMKEKVRQAAESPDAAEAIRLTFSADKVVQRTMIARKELKAIYGELVQAFVDNDLANFISPLQTICEPLYFDIVEASESDTRNAA